MKNPLPKFNKSAKVILLVAIAVVLFMPFPTEMIPEWKMQVVDEQNQPLADVRAEQSWRNYAFWGGDGYVTKCTDSNGYIVFPRRFFWAGTVSRIVFPLLAKAVTPLSHGSTGTYASVRLFDRNYRSDYDYWPEREEIYKRTKEKLPRKAIAIRSERDNAEVCG